MNQAVQDVDNRRPWGPRIKNSLRARWLGYPLVVVLLVISYFVGNTVAGRKRFFTERDATLSYPYREDTVPIWSLVFIAGLGPMFIVVLTQVLIRKSSLNDFFDRRTKDIHLALIVLAEVLSVTWLITTIIKSWVGRLRPDFFAYCDYKGYRNAVDTGNLTEYFQNTFPGQPGDFKYCNLDVLDAHFSFPSGHSSVSFCGMTFLAWFLIHVTGRLEFRHHSIGKTIRVFIVLIPFFSAALVAASRIIDYKHNVEDTIWGALIGVLGASLVFHANYAYPRTSEPPLMTVIDFENVFEMRPYPNQHILEIKVPASANSPLIKRGWSDNSV